MFIIKKLMKRGVIYQTFLIICFTNYGESREKILEGLSLVLKNSFHIIQQKFSRYRSYLPSFNNLKSIQQNIKVDNIIGIFSS